MAKPADFFIGIVDFFAVLLPGAILTGIVVRAAPGIADDFSSGAGAAAFAVAAYVLGQLAYALGTVLDRVYDKLYVERWKRRSGDDPYLVRAREAAAADRPPGDDLYDWADAYVRVNVEAGAAEVDRLQADSKFFRTLTVVAAAGAVLGAIDGEAWIVGAGVVLFPFSFGRFLQRRWKATETVYRYFVLARTTSN